MEMELKVAIIQSPLAWENPEKNREHFSKKLNAVSEEVDLVILPEMFTTGFTMTPWNIAKEEGGETVKWMQMEAKRKKVALTGSMVYFAERILINFKGFRICPLICYDLRFPVWARNTENYDVLIYVANWPRPRINAWDALLKARAIENMAYVIGVNRTGTDNTGHNYPGHSTVNDVFGQPIVFSEEEQVLYATL